MPPLACAACSQRFLANPDATNGFAPGPPDLRCALLAKDTPCRHELLRRVDSTPVAAGMARKTTKRSDLAGDAGYGYGTSHARYYWGFSLYLIATPEGPPVLWALANPKIEEREVTQAMLE